MNTYTKMTISAFRKKLRDGGFKDASGARKSLGKTKDLSDAEKDQCRKLIDKHFNVEPVKSAPKKATRQPVVKAGDKPPSAPEKKVKEVQSKKLGAGRGTGRKAKKAATKHEHVETALDQVEKKAVLCRDAIDTYRKAAELLKETKGEQTIEASLTTIHEDIKALLSVLHHDVVAPMSSGEEHSNALFGKAVQVAASTETPAVPSNGASRQPSLPFAPLPAPPPAG